MLTSLLIGIALFQTELDVLTLDQASIEGIELGNNSKSIYDHLGSPNKLDTLIDEIGDGKEFVQFIYEEITISVKEDRIIGYDIRSSKYRLKYGDIDIGTTEEKIEQLLSKSYAQKWSSGDYSETVTVLIEDSEEFLQIGIMDGKVSIIYNWKPS